MKKIVKDSVTQAVAAALSTLLVELVQKWIASRSQRNT